MTANYIFILDTNNIISAYNRAAPKVLLSQYTEYRYSASSQFMVRLSADLAESVLVLTAHTSGVVSYKILGIGANGVLTFIN